MESGPSSGACAPATVRPAPGVTVAVNRRVPKAEFPAEFLAVSLCGVSAGGPRCCAPSEGIDRSSSTNGQTLARDAMLSHSCPTFTFVKYGHSSRHDLAAYLRVHIMMVTIHKPLALISLAASCVAFGGTARAVDQTVDFGAPTVLSQQGQRLKVLVPVRSAPDDRATAASFLVRETEVPQGFQALPAQDFTVLRPARSDYVVFQSGDVVRSPEVTLLVSVAGDPRSPYRMDLKVPPASASADRLAISGAGSVARDSRAGKGSTLSTRKLRGPIGEANLPPK